MCVLNNIVVFFLQKIFLLTFFFTKLIRLNFNTAFLVSMRIEDCIDFKIICVFVPPSHFGAVKCLTSTLRVVSSCYIDLVDTLASKK